MSATGDLNIETQEELQDIEKFKRKNEVLEEELTEAHRRIDELEDFLAEWRYNAQEMINSN